MNRQQIFRPAVLSLFLLVLISCGNDGFTPAPEVQDRGKLVSATSRSTYTSDTLRAQAKAGGLSNLSPWMLYAVKTYKLVYWTVDTTGTPIKVSGQLAIPSNSNVNTTRLVAYHHGTIFHTAYAPTNSSSQDILSAMLASMDFIVALPDYIGYGESVAALHPYMHADSLAKTSIDLLRAAKEFMSGNNIAFSNRLLLGGYSEGGYAALATHKMIQQSHSGEFTVTATAAGAGAYDMLETANTLLGENSLPSASYVAFVFKAYDEIYQFNRISEIFNPDFVETINNDFYGTVDDSDIEGRLDKNTATLFNPTFLASFRAGNEQAINSRLTENNIYDWTPQAPVRLYHGQDDAIVPYTNTVTAYNAMTSSGAAVVTVSNCTPSQGLADHNNCYIPYLVNMVEYFLAQ